MFPSGQNESVSDSVGCPARTADSKLLDRVFEPAKEWKVWNWIVSELLCIWPTFERWRCLHLNPSGHSLDGSFRSGFTRK